MSFVCGAPPLVGALLTAASGTSSSTCGITLEAERLVVEAGRIEATGSPRVIRCPDEPPLVEAERIAASEGIWRAERARIRPCGCIGGPELAIQCRSVTVDPERGGWAVWPVVEVDGTPVFGLPVAYVPLGDRKSGLLAPRFRWSPPFGFEAAQPVYVVLGRSHDLTITPSIASRRGPGAELELRGAPRDDVRYHLAPEILFDFGEPRSAGFRWARSEPIVRHTLDGDAVAGVGRVRFGADLAIRGDPAWQAERGSSFEARQSEWTRSRLTVGGSSMRSLRWSMSAHLFQDLRPDTYGDVDDLREVSLWSGETPGPGEVRYRFFESRLALTPRALGRRLPVFSGFASRFDGATSWSGDPAGYARADLRPELFAPVPLPWGLVFEPGMAARGTVWVGSDERGTSAGGRVAPVLWADLGQELRRGYGRFVHRIRPRLRSRWIVAVAENLPPSTFDAEDEVDLLEPAAQMSAELATELMDLRRPNRRVALELAVGHDFGWEREGVGTLEGRALADGEWSLGASPWTLLGDADVIWSFAGSELRQLVVRAGFRRREGHEVVLGYRRQTEEVAAWTFRAPEELVPSNTVRPTGFVPVEERQASPAETRAETRPASPQDALFAASQVAILRWLRARMRVVLAFDDPDILEIAYGFRSSILQSLTGSVEASPGCGCWSAFAYAGTARDRGGWDVGLGLRLGPEF